MADEGESTVSWRALFREMTTVALSRSDLSITTRRVWESALAEVMEGHRVGVLSTLGSDPGAFLLTLEREDESAFWRVMEQLYESAATALSSGCPFDEIPEVTVIRSVGAPITADGIRAPARPR